MKHVTKTPLLWFFSLALLLNPPYVLAESFKPSEKDIQFLELVERKAFNYFLVEHHSDTGLVKDKANNFGKDSETLASIAATGFGLSAMVVGAERGWVSKKEAQKYCERTLRFFWDGMETNHGFFYHFVDWKTGKKTKQTELSSIDTALFLAGALTAAEYFKGTEVEDLANQIYKRVDFYWMLNGGKTLSMGWDPREGFLKMRWEQYNESLLLYILAIGSPTHPISPDSWRQVNKRIGTYGSYTLIYSPPLFTHQYPAIWLDLKNKNDGFADYFENSRIATIVNRQFCLDQRNRFKTYSENIWGLTASLAPNGYKAYGSEPGGAVQDGTVAPTAAGSSIVFTPELSINAMKYMYEKLKDKLWGKYGFTDAFNLDRNWYAKEVLGIDQGPLLLMIENFRSELLWKLFMQHPSVTQGMAFAGFHYGTLQIKRPVRPVISIGRTKGKVVIDGDLDDWDLSHSLALESPQHRELGEVSGPEDVSGKLFFAWDEDFFYLAARILDESIVIKRTGDKIWKDDLLELFFDPEEDGLEWGNPKDFQIGFSPGELPGEGRNWAWFQGFDASQRGDTEFKIKRQKEGYDVEAKISWKFLGISPHSDLSFGFSPAIHDVDRDGSEAKLIWFYLPDGKSKRASLGQALLK